MKIYTREKYERRKQYVWRNERAKKKYPELANDPDTIFINGVAFTFNKSEDIHPVDIVI